MEPFRLEIGAAGLHFYDLLHDLQRRFVLAGVHGGLGPVHPRRFAIVLERFIFGGQHQARFEHFQGVGVLAFAAEGLGPLGERGGGVLRGRR